MTPDSAPPVVCYSHQPHIDRPAEPVRVALVGAGDRMWNVYLPALVDVAPWVRVVAVCNRNPSRRNALADRLGVPGFAHIRDLVSAGPCEAAITVLPPALNHPVSLYLSGHGIHHMAETPMSLSFRLATQMVQTARRQGVVLRVAENFFRFARDRFAHVVRDSGIIGDIHRIICHGSIVGYHTSARWVKFAGAWPQSVQAVEHTAPTHGHRSGPGGMGGPGGPGAWHTQETFQARWIGFPGNLFVMDSCANRKGYLGRHPRDGRTEWQGERGTLVDRPADPTATWTYTGPSPVRRDDAAPSFTPGVMSLRRCSGPHADPLTGLPAVSHVHDEESPVRHLFEGRDWRRSFAHTSQGLIEYVNPLRTSATMPLPPAEYAVSIAGHLVDFALAVRSVAPGEFDDDAALATMAIEAAARESVLQGWRAIAFPLPDRLESDEAAHRQLRQTYGTTPDDVDGMLNAMDPAGT